MDNLVEVLISLKKKGNYLEVIDTLPKIPTNLNELVVAIEVNLRLQQINKVNELLEKYSPWFTTVEDQIRLFLIK